MKRIVLIAFALMMALRLPAGNPVEGMKLVDALEFRMINSGYADKFEPILKKVLKYPI